MILDGHGLVPQWQSTKENLQTHLLLMDTYSYTRQPTQLHIIPATEYQDQLSNTNAALGLHLRMTVTQTELSNVKEVGRQTSPL